MRVPTSCPRQRLLLPFFFTLAILVSVKSCLNMALCMVLTGCEAWVWPVGNREWRGAIIFAIREFTAQSGGRLIDTFFIPTLITVCQTISGLNIKRDTEVDKVHILTISTIKDSFNEEYKTFAGSLSVCPSIHPPVQSSIHPTTKHSTSSPPKHPPIHLSTHSFNYPPFF